MNTAGQTFCQDGILGAGNGRLDRHDISDFFTGLLALLSTLRGWRPDTLARQRAFLPVSVIGSAFHARKEWLRSLPEPSEMKSR